MTLYRLLSLRNNLKALVKGRLQQRAVRKVIYRKSFGLARMVCRALGVWR